MTRIYITEQDTTTIPENEGIVLHLEDIASEELEPLQSPTYQLKQPAARHLLSKIRELVSEENAFCEREKALDSLTAREKEVLALIAQGLSNKQIGEKLFISPKTVDCHRTNLMRKLEVHNVVELVRCAGPLFPPVGGPVANKRE